MRISKRGLCTIGKLVQLISTFNTYCMNIKNIKYTKELKYMLNYS